VSHHYKTLGLSGVPVKHEPQQEASLKGLTRKFSYGLTCAGFTACTRQLPAFFTTKVTTIITSCTFFPAL